MNNTTRGVGRDEGKIDYTCLALMLWHDILDIIKLYITTDLKPYLFLY
jgi:hypothetical protein